MLAVCVGFVALTYRTVFVYTARPDCPPTARRPPALDMETQTPSRPIRVLSYNIEGHAALVRRGHLEAIARVIREQDPDVVGLQEVHRGTWQSRFRDQAAELGERTGMTVHFGKSFGTPLGVGGAEFGNAILTRAALRDPEVVALPSFGEPRSMLRATVSVEGVEFDFMVTHLAAWGQLNRRVRGRQTGCLLEHARASTGRVVLCGDFNAHPDSSEMTALLSGGWAQLCGLPGQSTYPLLKQRIDYILAGPGWQVGKTAVIETGPSDHWPIVAELMPSEA
jgi:endonuclease/exonuclease/phosphatase family metal-dependent hydrolase